MGFNSVGQYTGSHKAWDHVGNMIPDVEHSEGIRPHGEYMPAAWLPVVFWEKFYENWIVMMPGKVVAFDNDGRLVPAGYGVTDADVVYTASDVTAGTIDVSTGLPVTAAKTVGVDEVVAFMGRTGVTMAISKPIGVISYPVLQWAGDGSADDDGFNPAALKHHNYNMQHRVAILCDYVLELPIVPARTADGALTYASYSDNVATFTAVDNLPVAKNTMRTPITVADNSITGASTHFVNQVATAAELLALGDWTIDYATGVVKAFWATDPGAGAFKITYSNYASAPAGTAVSVFACVLGDPKPGDFVKCNADSNLIVDTAPSVADTVGQILDIETEPKDLLDKVKTAYTSIGTSGAGAYPGYAGQMDQMAGSATGGVSGKVHYAGAANKVCRVNLILR